MPRPACVSASRRSSIPTDLHDVAVVGAGPGRARDRRLRRLRGTVGARCSITAPSAGRPALRRGSRIISASRPAFPAWRWPAAPSTRRRSSAPRSPFRSKSTISTAADRRGGRTSRCGSNSPTAAACAAGRWSSRPARATGSRTIAEPRRCSRARACPTGPRRSKRSSARARRSRLIGGGNSAGQAVVFLAPKVKHAASRRARRRSRSDDVGAAPVRRPPTNGMPFAITVMNSTLVSSGRLAI